MAMAWATALATTMAVAMAMVGRDHLKASVRPLAGPQGPGFAILQIARQGRVGKWFPNLGLLPGRLDQDMGPGLDHDLGLSLGRAWILGQAVGSCGDGRTDGLAFITFCSVNMLRTVCPNLWLPVYSIFDLLGRIFNRGFQQSLAYFEILSESRPACWTESTTPNFLRTRRLQCHTGAAF